MRQHEFEEPKSLKVTKPIRLSPPFKKSRMKTGSKEIAEIGYTASKNALCSAIQIILPINDSA
jgi:hypothetical protein